MPPESGENVQIANRLFLQFALLLGTDRVRGHGLVDAAYTKVETFQGDNLMRSPQFHKLRVTGAQILG